MGRYFHGPRMVGVLLASSLGRCWAEEGQPRVTFRGHTNWVHAVALSPDGKILASGSKDRTIEQGAKEMGGLAGALHRGEAAKVAGTKIGDVLIALMAPAFRPVLDGTDRIEQVQADLHVAFALAAYRGAQGRYPATLDELSPKYLATVPGDLSSGKALIYRPSEEGYLLYSVGVNGKDEGGHWYDDDPPGDDLRVRMPLPELKPKK